MKLFVSWSGGKDCLFATYLYLREHPSHSIACLLHMQRAVSAHGYAPSLLQAQASAMQLPFRCHTVGDHSYESAFKAALAGLKSEGINHGIFGDIYLEEHKKWIDRVCEDAGITPIYPLWGMGTEAIMREFVRVGFQSLIVAIDKSIGFNDYIGRTIDNLFIDRLLIHPELDVCGERGEYHSFVYDGPMFAYPVPFMRGTIHEQRKYLVLPLHPSFQ